MPDILPIGEAIAKGIKHVGGYLADAIAERRNAFSDDEDGDYLRCAGADALAEALAWPDPHVTVDLFRCVEHKVDLSKCARMPHSEGDEWRDDPSVCYFCDRPTDRVVTTSDDGDREFVCEKCADVANAPAAAPDAADDPAGCTPPTPAGSLTFQKSEHCWCGDGIDVTGTESAVLMACSHFRIDHSHYKPNK